MSPLRTILFLWLQLYPQCFNTAYKILKMIQRQFDVIIDESEIVYLALHIYHFEAQINIKR